MPFLISISLLSIVIALSLPIPFAPKTTLYTRTTEGLKYIKSYVNLTCLETRPKAEDSEVSSSRHSFNAIFS
jgi:hypothetical protein